MSMPMSILPTPAPAPMVTRRRPRSARRMVSSPSSRPRHLRAPGFIYTGHCSPSTPSTVRTITPLSCLKAPRPMPHVLLCARGGAQHGGRPWGPFQPIQATLGLSSPASLVPVQSIPGRFSPNWHCRSGSRGQSVPNTAPHSLSHFRPFGSLHREGPRSKTLRRGTCEGEMGKDCGDTMRRQKMNTRLGMQRDRYPTRGGLCYSK
ncbi:hypothetical protein LZ31DRAFT_259309 [Colletotrichum somersetense]|nr:hypothetical protein LZ31DRAFT_259309 [Colletotrichum somersetense]